MRTVTAAVLIATCSVVPLLAGQPGEETTTASGGWPLEPFTSEAAKVLTSARRYPPQDGEAVQVLLQEAHYRYYPDGRADASFTLVYRLLTQAGVERWGTAEEMWEPWHEARPEIRARVITPDGAEHSLEPSTLSESPAQEGGPAIFDDRRVVHGPLPALVPGVVVEERESTHETRAKYPEGSIHTYYPIRSIPVHHARLVVDVPAGMPFRFRTDLLGDVRPLEKKIGDTTRWIFNFYDLEAYDEPESGLPREIPRVARITFSTASSWRDVAAKYAEIVDRKAAETNIDEVAQRVAASAENREARIAAVVDFIHKQVRYTGLEFGQSSIVPHAPETVLTRQFGDCKDQAVLAVSLLRSLGIPARVALLSSSFGRDVLPDLAGLGAFNHAIVFIPGEPARWLDTTDRFSPPTSLPLSDQGRLALVVDPTTTELVRIPAARAADNFKKQVRTFHLADYGKTAITVDVYPAGSFENTLRRSYAGQTKEDMKKDLKNWVANEFLADDLSSLSFSNPEDLSTPFEVHLGIDSAKRGLTSLLDAVVAIRLDDLIDELPSSLLQALEKDDDGKEKHREHGFVFLRPFVVQWTYRIPPLLGFSVRKLPESREQQLGTIKLSTHFEKAGDGTVLGDLILDSGKRRITAKEFEETRKAVQDLREEDPIVILFQNDGMADLAAGRIKKALAELAAVARETPRKAVHLARVATALLQGGLGEEARKVAEQAVALEPDSLPAHSTLGWVLQHDRIGRRFGKEWDREAALAAYERAVKLADADRDLKLNYAILLEFNQKGLRYTTGTDLEKAISLYQALLDEKDSDAIRHNMVIAQLHAGHAADVAKMRPEIGGSSQLDQAIAAAVAMVDGADEATSVIEGAYSSADSRREVFRGAALLLAQFRRYAAASALARNAAGGASNAAQLLAWAHNLERIHRFESVHLDQATPEGTAKEFLKRLWLDGNASKKVKALLTSRAWKRLEVDRANGESSAEELAESLQRSQGVVPEVGIDAWLTLSNSRVNGKDTPVRRVTLKLYGPGGSFSLGYYVLPRKGVYRVLATDDTLEVLGDEALDELAQGNLSGARQLLDWARQKLGRIDSADPFSGLAFPKLWTKGAKATAPRVELAAAALIAQGPQPKRGLKTLKRRLQEGLQDEERLPALQALTQAYLTESRYDKADAIVEDLLPEHADSGRLFSLQIAWLVRSGRADEAERLARRRLEEKTDDLAALRRLAYITSLRGDFDEADRLLETVSDSHDAMASDLNQRAWLALFRNSVDGQALGWAYSAVQKTKQESASYLHTLASLLAESDRPGDALQVIRQAIELEPHREPQPHDWYVFGRMAESYGFDNAARADYLRVEAPKDRKLERLSTWELAQQRLNLLAQKAREERSAP